MKEEQKPCLHTLMLNCFYGQSERAYYLNYFINSTVQFCRKLLLL